VRRSGAREGRRGDGRKMGGDGGGTLLKGGGDAVEGRRKVRRRVEGGTGKREWLGGGGKWLKRPASALGRRARAVALPCDSGGQRDASDTGTRD
jgi:hypothetical protein